MKPDVTYAIVDIEATDNSSNVDSRIIQFACVLYRNGKIVEKFNTLIQPEVRISKYITRLTGITNQMVATAPYFEEVALLITTMLEDTIFVAHNVGFDFRFLNEQLEKEGIAPLTNQTIDTVDLSQILWPAAPSYQLEDLAKYIGCQLTQAHDALADAEVTMELLQALWQRAIELPAVTLKQLTKLSQHLAFDTSIFFKQALAIQAAHLTKRSEEKWIEIEGLAIRRYELPIQHKNRNQNYPQTIAEKKAYFTSPFAWRTEQWDMMDKIYEHLQTNPKAALAVEAPAGIGKTLAYLSATSFLITEEQPLLISTQTTLLQEQVKQTVITQLNALNGSEYQVAIVKSAQHYLNLSAFSAWLKQIDAYDSSAYSCMRILVWLTDTTTGDLGEIGRGSEAELAFWELISGEQMNVNKALWHDIDFLNRRRWLIKTADILITNHTYLVHDWSKKEPVLPTMTYTIFDEAHHLPDVTAWQVAYQLQKKSLGKSLEQLEHLLMRQVPSIIIDEIEIERALQCINWQKAAFALYFKKWEQKLHAEIDTSKSWQTIEFAPSQQTISEKRLYKDILANGRYLINILKQLKMNLKTHDYYSSNEQLHHLKNIERIDQYTQWMKIFKSLFNYAKDTDYMYWVKVNGQHQIDSMTYKMSKLLADHLLLNRYRQNKKLIFTSSSLSEMGENKIEYFSKGLGDLEVTLTQLSSPYDYQNQAQVLLPEQPLLPEDKKEQQYALKITQLLEQLLQGTQFKVMVIFHSRQLLDAVYEHLVEREQLREYHLFAQGNSGSRRRILRRFKKSRAGLLLGSDSFSEGLDLPDKQLDVIILPRLPFDSPEQPLIEMYRQMLPKASELFKKVLLPRATMRFKQIFGRLIRSPKDQGLLIILDERYQKASYKKAFSRSLPEKLPQKVLATSEIKKVMQSFFK